MFKGVIIILRGRKDVPSIFGCIDTLAFNYDPSANTDNNTATTTATTTAALSGNR